MEIPAETVAVGRILRASRRTAARLKANPQAKVLQPKFKAQHDALKARQTAYNDADDLAIDAGATVDECDVNAREAVTGFQLDLVSEVRRDYGHPLYVSFFAKGFAAAKDSSGADLQTVTTTLVSEIAKQPKDSKLHAHSKPLKAAADAYTAPLADQKKAQANKNAAATALSIERSKWIAAYDGLAGELRALFPRRKALVESFFGRFSSTRSKGKVAGGEAPK